MNYNFKDLKSQLIKGKVDATIDALADIAKNELKDKNLEKELTVLHYRWEKIQREERQNVISYDQASITKNQITSAVLEVLDKIQQKILKGGPSQIEKSTSLIKYIAGVAVLLIVASVVYFSFIKEKSISQESSVYINCPFQDTVPYNILIIPFENYNSDKQERKISTAIREGLSLSTSRNNLNSLVRIHEREIDIPDEVFARRKLEECKANLLIWGTYEETDSIDITIKYVADDLISKVMEEEGIQEVSTLVKSISSLARGEIISKFEDILGITTPFITGLNMIKEKKLNEALSEFGKIELKSNKVKNLVSKAKGDVHLMKKDYDAAIDSYSESIQKGEDNADPYNNIGYALYQKGDLEGAYENFQKAVQLGQANSDIQENFRIIDEEFKKLNPIAKESDNQEQQIEEIQALVVIPDEEKLPTICTSFIECNNEGNRLMAEGNPEEAVKYFNAALEYDKTRAEPYLNIGVTHFNKQDYDRALFYFTKATEIEPKFPNSYYHLRETYFRKGDQEKANEYNSLFNSLGGKLIGNRKYNQ